MKESLNSINGMEEDHLEKFSDSYVVSNKLVKQVHSVTNLNNSENNINSPRRCLQHIRKQESRSKSLGKRSDSSTSH